MSASLAWRAHYLYLRDGFADTDAHGDIVKEAGKAGARGSQTRGCYIYLAYLFHRRNADQALQYLRDMGPDNSHSYTLFKVAFLLDKDLTLARRECWEAVTNRTGWRDRESLSAALRLAGLPQDARRAADEYRNEPAGWPAWTDQARFVKRVRAHASRTRASRWTSTPRRADRGGAGRWGAP